MQVFIVENVDGQVVGTFTSKDKAVNFVHEQMKLYAKDDGNQIYLPSDCKTEEFILEPIVYVENGDCVQPTEVVQMYSDFGDFSITASELQ